MSKYSEFFLLGKADYMMIGDKLRLRKFGSWLAEEGWTKEEQARQRASFSLKAVDLARKIAKEQEISEEEAFDVLQQANETRSEIFEQYATEIDELMALMPSGREQFEELVTLFFRNRGQVKVDKKWEPFRCIPYSWTPRRNCSGVGGSGPSSVPPMSAARRDKVILFPVPCS